MKTINLRNLFRNQRNLNLDKPVAFCIGGVVYTSFSIGLLSCENPNYILFSLQNLKTEGQTTLLTLYDVFKAYEYQSKVELLLKVETDQPFMEFPPKALKARYGDQYQGYQFFGEYQDFSAIVNKKERYNSKHYTVEIGGLKNFLWDRDNDNEMGRKVVELNPEFQRGYVWTLEQKIAFVENFLHNPYAVNRNLHFNDGYLFNALQTNAENNFIAGKFVCLDGLQRLTAIVDFMNGKFAIFDGQLTWQDIEAAPNQRKLLEECHFDCYVHEFRTNKEVVNFYVDFNAAGVAHTKEEIDRVKALIV